MKRAKPKPKRQKIKPRTVDTDKVCGNCVYYGVDGTCRRSAPVTSWPAVAATDWCAEGYSYVMEWYDPAPRLYPRN